MEFITSTQVIEQVCKHFIYEHEDYSNNHDTMEFFTCTLVTIQLGFTHYISSMKSIAITITQRNRLPILKYPYKWHSNIVSTIIKSIAITITQWNLLPILKYFYKWDSNIGSISKKSIAITITQWNRLPVLKYQYKWD